MEITCKCGREVEMELINEPSWYQGECECGLEWGGNDFGPWEVLE